MNRIRLTIEYDGTDYVGWQRQPNGLSVQEVVELALQQVVGHPVQIISSGRTDAGVHARGMVVHFDTSCVLPMTAYREGVNAHLPMDIVITDAMLVSPEFHARYSALAKRYRYTLSIGATRSPLASRFSWHLRSPLDIESMRVAAESLVGRHDFAAFRSSGCVAKSTIREIFSIRIKRHGRMQYIDVIGSGFLRNMVRVIVGTLVEVGRGKRTADEVRQLLVSCDRDRAGATAPPQGLCLMQVWYDGEPGCWSADLKPCKSCQKTLDN